MATGLALVVVVPDGLLLVVLPLVGEFPAIGVVVTVVLVLAGLVELVVVLLVDDGCACKGSVVVTGQLNFGFELITEKTRRRVLAEL